ncbi:endonuclease MutS2 [Lachnospira multipara]|uniref:Endonuclease MutS2 n=1 Tax=Lachnospira multipara TaxID=28051 RepID=A0A1H5SSX6_9FIRM|nr:endonuclease MutS2 [Lachnospira multipara]SEF52897.1 DNA mismatch repair protein MutS2 [Lachnospira multipara]
MNKKAIYTLEFNKIQEQLVTKASSEGAKAILRKLKIETDINIINEKLDETNDALSRIFQKGSLDFSKVRDIRDSLLRLKMGSSLNTRELLNISDILTLSKQIKEYYEYKEDSLQPSIDALEEATSLNNQIKRCILSEDEIADEASATLSDIRRNKRLSSDKIHTELNRLLNSSSVRNCLQDFVITSRNGRYCLPVKAEYKSQVPGMVHDQSSTGSTLFIEPASVVKLNNDIKELELKEQAEIEVILAKLSASANEYQDVLLSDYELLTNLDVAFAKGNLSKQMKAARPTMNNNGIINIKKGRHPLIEQHVVVPIDIYLGRDFKLLIITGPNTGGKTVSLKTVGLLTLMAQAGLNIPALEHSDIAVFENVFADIGDEQSIEQSLSTFSSHMTNQVKILRHANEKSLVLFDEIGAGTDPTEGAALATSILNHLKNKNVTTMATTHYSELKMYALTTEGVENASCEFDVETLSPTYKLLIGVPGKSNAFAISKKLGLPEYILKDASKRLEEDDIKFEDLVTDLENTRAKLEREKEEITAYKAEIESLKEKLESKNERIDQSKDKILRRANEQAAAILQEAKDYADETIKVMNKSGMSVKELEKRRTEVRTKINKRNEKLKVEPAKLTKHTSSNIEDFKKGMYVRVLTMNVIGRITDIYPTKKQVNVLIGSLSTKMPIKNLEILENYKDPEESKANASKTSTGSSKIKMGKAAHVKTEINLLGYTVDEAISVLDKYLDDAYIAKIPQVRIVHGKGTGALRNGITAYLRGVPYIASFRLGNIGEGDAGVTIVDFK